MKTTEWISVKTRLPEELVRVLYSYHGEVDVACRCGDIYLDDNSDRVIITHWMPFPEPHKGESND